MRLFITTLSLFSVISFGYALAGYGGKVLGGTYRGDYVLWGLLLGFAFAAVAMWLWYRHRAEFYEPISPDQNPNANLDQNLDLAEQPLDAPDWGKKVDLNAVTRYDAPDNKSDK